MTEPEFWALLNEFWEWLNDYAPAIGVVFAIIRAPLKMPSRVSIG